MKVSDLLMKAYRKFCPQHSVIEQAKRAGVKMGGGNDIASKFWEAAEPYLIEVGDNNQITEGVKFYTHGGSHTARYIYPHFDCFGKIKIGNWNYFGNDVKIMPGVTIGDHVIIAAGSIVTRSCPNNVVIGGNPARLICSLEEYINRNMRYNINSKGLSASEKQALLLSLDEDRFIKKQVLEQEKTAIIR